MISVFEDAEADLVGQHSQRVLDAVSLVFLQLGFVLFVARLVRVVNQRVGQHQEARAALVCEVSHSEVRKQTCTRDRHSSTDATKGAAAICVYGRR